MANAIYSGNISLKCGNITFISVSSTATTTYTFTTITISLTNTNPIPKNGYVIIVLPAELTLLSVCQLTLSISGTLITSQYTNYLTNNTIIVKITGLSISSSSTMQIAISNIMTQNYTKTTSTFTVTSFDNNYMAVDASTNSMGLAIS